MSAIKTEVHTDGNRRSGKRNGDLLLIIPRQTLTSTPVNDEKSMKPSNRMEMDDKVQHTTTAPNECVMPQLHSVKEEPALHNSCTLRNVSEVNHVKPNDDRKVNANAVRDRAITERPSQSRTTVILPGKERFSDPLFKHEDDDSGSCHVQTNEANVTNEGLDCKQPSTSGCKRSTKMVQQCENGVSEERINCEDNDVVKYYYMTEDSLEDVISKLEEELLKEESEANEKKAAAEEMMKEMEKDAKNTGHFLELREKQDKQNTVCEKLRAERKRIAELKRQLALANRDITLFCCFFCNRVFVNEEIMRQHISEKHQDQTNRKDYKYKCPSCSHTFANKYHLRRHVELHKSVRELCSVCKREFRGILSLRIHMSAAHGLSTDGKRISKKYECKCGKRFGIIEELKRHKYFCKSKEKIAEKRRKNREDIVAKCSDAAKNCPADSIISSSSDTAVMPSIGSPYGRPVKDKSCPFCFNVFASMQSRRRHIENKHPKLVGDPRVDSHDYVKLITPALPYVCDVCYKAFATHHSLSKHKKSIHDKVRNHECTICGRRYTLPSELRKHVKRAHEKDKK